MSSGHLCSPSNRLHWAKTDSCPVQAISDITKGYVFFSSIHSRHEFGQGTSKAKLFTNNFDIIDIPFIAADLAPSSAVKKLLLFHHTQLSPQLGAQELKE